MIEGNVTLDGNGYRVFRAFAGERAPGEISRALLYALIDGRMNRNSHDEPLISERLLPRSNSRAPARRAGARLAPNDPLKRHDAADRFTAVHELESVVDLLDRHHMGDEVVDIDLLVHVPVDNARHLGTATDTAECRAFPDAPGDELERPGADFLAGAGDANNHRYAPATMRALERLTHEVDITHALEAVIGPTVGECNQVRDEVTSNFLGIDEVRHAELVRERLSFRVDVDTNDLVRANHMRALNHIQSDTAQAKYHDVGPGFDLRSVQNHADAGRNPAADVTDLLKRGVLADLGKRNLRQHGVVGKR